METPEWTPRDEGLIRVRVRHVYPDGKLGVVWYGYAEENHHLDVVEIPATDLLPTPDPDAPTVEDVLEAGVEEVIAYWPSSGRANKDDCMRLRDRIVDRARQLWAEREETDGKA